ncbi:Bug family tripartite tricarboxylate transporter substrate binding protein [Nitrincola sp.]|uniref:Bug family tripartite tricarboxylate transporter substrate binding protein n=1 Tax=Nitrincola sp. TaxID=1926584 RepID=UPI003A927635
MIKNKKTLCALTLASIASFASVTGAYAAEFKPESPDCIAPAGAGGGWDFICRSTAKYLFDLGLIEDTMQVTNMSGGGGGVAYAYVSNERNEDNSLIVAASNGTTSRLAQDAYPGSTPDDVRWLATFGAEYGAIAVAKDSEYKDLKSLMDAVVADPRKVAWSGGSAVGGYDHIKPLMLAKAAGLQDARKLKYVAFPGGGEAMTALLSNAVQVFSGDFSEIRGFAESGDVRVLAVMSPERLSGYEQFPTAIEQGYDVIGPNWRGLYIPKGASEEAYEYWTNAVKKLTEDADSPPKCDTRLCSLKVFPKHDFRLPEPKALAGPQV